MILHHVQNESQLASTDLQNLRNEISIRLHPNEEPQFGSQSRVKRAAPLAFAALASVGLFGSGILLGSSEGCGLRGKQDKAKENANNILRLARISENIAENVYKLRSESNEKFYLLTNEVSKLHQIQQELAETQDNNWKIIENQFAVFQNNIHLLRDCTQLLFSRQQMNFNYDTMAALLTMTHTNIKAYCSALYAYQLNIVNAIPTILAIPTVLGQFLPMSLVPRQSLLKTLEEVIIEQGQADDRLTLAIPPKEILANYEAKLLTDVTTLEEGLLMTLSIPLASKQTSLTVHRATPIPMPQLEPTLAMKWKTETQFLAISEDNLETALLTEYDLANCIGSATYQICHRSIATERGHGSCLATLFFKGSLESIQECETEVIELPAVEKAENLGYGVWLVTSATKAYTLYETTSDSNTATGLTKYPGCNICIITLACGKQLTGPHNNSI